MNIIKGKNKVRKIGDLKEEYDRLQKNMVQKN